MKLPSSLLSFFDKYVDGLAITSGPSASIFGGAGTAGEVVDQDTALSLAAFWACARYVSSTVAMLPWGTYQANSSGGREPLRKHRMWSLLHDLPRDGCTPFTFKEALVWGALLHGNGYAEKSSMRVLDPTHVVPRLTDAGNLVYEYSDPLQGGEKRTLLSAEVFHLKGPSRDGMVGMSVLTCAREGISFGLSVQRFGAAFFGNGTHVGGIYQAEQPLNDVQFETVMKQLESQKGAKNSHKPKVLAGLKYIPDTIPPQDAQFLESRKFNSREICALFGVPPHKVGLEEGATAYASREQADLEAVTDCIMPWVVRMEQEANIKFLTPRERADGIYTHMSLDMLLRGDSKTRAEVYQTMIRGGAMRPNTALSLEDMPTDPDGDQLLVPRDLIPLSMVRELAESQIAANTPPETLDAPDGMEPDEDDAADAMPMADYFAPLVADALDCIKTRAVQDRERGRPPESTLDFARRKLAPLTEAHAIAGLPFDSEALCASAIGATDE